MKNSLLIILCIINACAFGQTNSYEVPNFAPKSPEAAAFLKYGEYPVDLSTGVPSISIPIYTIEGSGYNIPISLNYHASGIKVTQEATWVGLGWNLNFGAQIILSARDDVDENNPYIDDIPDADEVYNFWDDHPYAFNGDVFFSEHLDMSRVKDAYVFSSPTANGTFYIRNFTTNDVVIFPPDAFKVQLIGTSRSNLKFEITDVSGNVYVFNNTKEISERTLSHGDSYTSAWFVDQILTAKNEKFDFIYQSDGVLNDVSFSQRIDIKEDCDHCGECPAEVPNDTVTPVINEGSTVMTNSKKIHQIIFNQGASRILFSKTSGREDLINGNSSLGMIEIQNKNSSNVFATVKGFVFEYSYFISDENLNVASYKKKRLKLDRVIDLIEGTGHEFKYSLINLPSKVSQHQDYYGYYNNNTGQDMIPRHYLAEPFAAQVGSAVRDVSPSRIQAGMLEEITYPTKGATKFIYEPNQHYGIDELSRYTFTTIHSSTVTGSGNPNSAADPVVGEEFASPVCRVPASSGCIYREVVNFNAINGTGRLRCILANSGNSDITVVKYKWFRVRLYSGGVVVHDSWVHTGRNAAADYIISNISLNGPGYLLVEAYGNSMSAYAELNFSNNDTTPKNTLGAGLRIKRIENYTRANILSSGKEYTYADVSNPARSSGKLINTLSCSFISKPFTSFTISSCGGDHPFYANLAFHKVMKISSSSQQGIEGNSIIYRYVTEKSIRADNGPSEGYTLYEFTTDPDEIPLGNPTVQIVTSWKRGKTINKKVYKTVANADYILKWEKNTYIEDTSKISFINGFKMFRHSTINVTEEIGQPLATPYYLSLYMGTYSVPHTVKQTVEPTTFNIPVPWFYLKETENTEYFYNDTNTLTNTLVTTKTFDYNNPVHLQLSSEKTTASDGQQAETKYFYAHDSEVALEPNINGATGLIARNMIGVPLLTKTLRGNAIVSEQKTEYAPFATAVPAVNNLLPKFAYTKKGTNAFEKRITYDYDDSGNVCQYTQENGTPVSIIWGYNKTKPIAKIENAAYSSINATQLANAQAASDTGNEAGMLTAFNSIQGSLPNAMISTYTYYPLVGVKSITDPKGDTTQYFYDDNGRLVSVRDKNNNILSENQYHYKN